MSVFKDERKREGGKNRVAVELVFLLLVSPFFFTFTHFFCLSGPDVPNILFLQLNVKR
jgi:hypothetical protein